MEEVVGDSAQDMDQVLGSPVLLGGINHEDSNDDPYAAGACLFICSLHVPAP